MNKISLIECRGVCSTKAPWTKLDDINLDIHRGEIFALVGESGSGKTTFINLLAGIINSEMQGDICFAGKPLDQETREKKIGFLFESPSLVPNLSVAENIFLQKFPRFKFLPLISWSKVRKAAQRMLNYYDFEIDVRKEIYQLSAEEKKIVEIVKIMVKNPQLIVLHEPTNGMSSETIDKLYRLIYNFKQSGGTVIYVTKEWEEALKIAERIAVIYEGKILGKVFADEAKKNPRKLLNMFLGNYNEKVTQDNEADTEVLDAVFKAAEYLTSEYELRDILHFFAEHATKVMNATGCVINLIDKKTSTIIDTVSFQGNKKSLVPEIRWEILEKAIHQNTIFYMSERDSEFESIFDARNGVKTVMLLPVLIRSQVTGIVQLYYENIFVYSEKEWKYINTLARQAALAVEDSRLMGRSVLLQESHHRIKNNLQSIVSIIILQKNFLKENIEFSEVENILDDIISRIKSIAAVHDLLAKDELGRSIINLRDIVQRVLNIAAYPNANKHIDIQLDLDDIFIPYSKATTIILIINELISNCFEHAFSGRQSGKIKIECKKEREGIALSVCDDGVGLPEDFSFQRVKSLGLNIVYIIIVKEFHGRIDFIRKESGADFNIFLPMTNGLLA